MRKEVRLEQAVIREKEVYIADDGTEFDSKWKCEEYEFDTLKKPLLDKLQRSKELETFANFDGQEYAEHHDYQWYFIRNEEDVDILNRVYGEKLDSSYIGKWINVESNDEGDAWVSTIDDGITYATTVLNKLGYKVEITKEAE